MENEPTEIKLWSPTTIGVTAFFLGFPGGALLATLNAHRMGDLPNKKKYIMNGILYVLAFFFVRSVFQDSGFGSILGLANFFLAYWLYHEMKDVIAKNTTEENVVEASWKKAALIALGTLVAMTLFFVIFDAVLTFFSYQ